MQFNRTLTHLQQLIETVNQSSSDIAHDLKKPIGRLRQRLDTARRDATKEVLAYFVDQVAQRRMEPTNDLVSELLAARMGDAPLTEKHLLGSCFLLLLAGVDTTWSAIGSSLEAMKQARRYEYGKNESVRSAAVTSVLVTASSVLAR